MARLDWSHGEAWACLSKADLAFHQSEAVVEIDLDGEKLVCSRTTVTQPELTGMGGVDDDSLATTLIQWLERELLAKQIARYGAAATKRIPKALAA